MEIFFIFHLTLLVNLVLSPIVGYGQMEHLVHLALYMDTTVEIMADTIQTLIFMPRGHPQSLDHRMWFNHIQSDFPLLSNTNLLT